MKVFKITLMALAISLTQISCDSTKDENKLEQVSVEDGKALIEDSSIDLLTEVDNFKNDAALNELYELARAMNSGSTGKKESTFLFDSFLEDATQLKSGKIDISDLSKNHTSAYLNGEETQDLQELYNENKGIWVWSDEVEDFIKLESSENIEFRVNFTVDGVDKQAKLVASNFSAKYLDSELQVVTSLNVEATINETQIMSYSFSASFSNYLPTSVISEYKLGALTFTETFTNSSNAELKGETAISINNKTLIKYTATISGDFTSIDNKGINYDIEMDGIPAIDKSSMELLINEILISGNIDFKSLNEAMANVAGEEAMEEFVTELNKHISLNVTSGNKEIAKVEFYVGTYEYTGYEWDNVTQEYKEVTQTNEMIEARFIFKDDSIADFETYFGENFSQLEEKLNSVFENYIDKFDL